MAIATRDVNGTPFVVVLYGSRARGDHDDLSDCDILIVGDPIDGSYRSPIGTSLVKYNWTEFTEMQQYGSLFMRHLRAEGRIIESNQCGHAEYDNLLANLPGYSRVMSDLHAFETAIDDCEEALISGDTSVEFELASLATVLRHSSILGCYLFGQDNFGRTQAVTHCCETLLLPDEIKHGFPSLYMFRIALARNGHMPAIPDVTYASDWIAWARLLVGRIASYAASSSFPR